MRSLLAILFAVSPTLMLAGQDAKLSEVDQLRVRLHRTEIALEQALSNAASCRAQFRSAQLSAEQSAMKSGIEKRHPGFSLDMQTGQLVKQEQAKPPAETK